MAMAKRHYIPHQFWHITQRCHKRESLLKFKQDRYRWIRWLFEAKRRFGLVVLNYVATSNHTHLILKDDSEHRIIPQAIGLVAGRTAQEYNQRKKRKGAFWEDRYHATAIESGEHLLQCLVLKKPWVPWQRAVQSSLPKGYSSCGKRNPPIMRFLTPKIAK